MYNMLQLQLDKFLRASVELCDNRGVDVVAGPILSGAMIAMGIVAHRPSLAALALGKPEKGYTPRVHTTRSKSVGGLESIYSLRRTNLRVLLVDDCISSGAAMKHAIKDLNEIIGTTANIVGILLSQDCQLVPVMRERIPELGDVPIYLWQTDTITEGK
jgi:adenine/guanine phosphoribosyltransferase-like PRPP-binding protein